MEYDKQDCPFYCFPGAVIEQQEEIAALKLLIRGLVEMLKNSETYECPNGGRAFCLSPHIVDPILNHPEIIAILKGLDRGC